MVADPILARGYASRLQALPVELLREAEIPVRYRIASPDSVPMAKLQSDLNNGAETMATIQDQEVYDRRASSTTTEATRRFTGGVYQQYLLSSLVLILGTLLIPPALLLI